MPKKPIAPWWARDWQGWWRNQQTTLRIEDPQGAFTYRDDLHEVRWRGALQTAGGARRITICWGPGTPYFAPQIFPEQVFSRMHQLRDGVLCLASPTQSEVVEIDAWLDQARRWFASYEKENWALTAEAWRWYAPLMPMTGYRLAQRTSSYVLLPPDFPPSSGRGPLVVYLPPLRQGLGWVRRWCAGSPPHERTWEPPGLVMHPNGQQLKGWWVAGMLELVRLVGELRSQPADCYIVACSVTWGHHTLTDFYLLEWRRGKIKPNLIIQGLPMSASDWSLRTRASRAAVQDKKIRRAQVVLVGLGALGSEVAHLLAKEQIGSFLLVDGDLLLPGNIGRHRLGMADVGKNKAEALKVHILQHHPDAEVIVCPDMLDVALPRLDVSEGAVFIGLSGCLKTERILAALCAQRGWTCLHSWLEFEGRVLRVLRSVPGLDPGLHELARLPPLPAAAEDGPEACADVVLPGTAGNIHAAANLVAQTALDVLSGVLPEENHLFFTPGGLSDDSVDVPAPLRQRYGLVSTRWTVSS